MSRGLFEEDRGLVLLHFLLACYHILYWHRISPVIHTSRSCRVMRVAVYPCSRLARPFVNVGRNYVSDDRRATLLVELLLNGTTAYNQWFHWHGSRAVYTSASLYQIHSVDMVPSIAFSQVTIRPFRSPPIILLFAMFDLSPLEE